MNRELIGLVGLDAALFIDAANGQVALSSDELGPEQRAHYLSFELADGGMNRLAELGFPPAVNQNTLVGGDWEGYHADPMVNEFYKPNQLLDTMCMFAQWSEDGSLGGIELYSSTARSPHCSPEAVARLRQLAPAFRSGLTAARQWASHRAELGGVLDVLAEGVAVHDRSGRPVYENARFRRLLATDPAGRSVRDEVLNAAHTLSASLRTGKAAAGASAPSVDRVCTTPSARYRLRSVTVGPNLLTPDVSILVVLEKLTREPPSEPEMRARFGLSRKEAVVALLLAQGMSNRSIAERLSISSHTARHHTERVLAKLDLDSRAGVSSRLASLGSP